MDGALYKNLYYSKVFLTTMSTITQKNGNLKQKSNKNKNLSANNFLNFKKFEESLTIKK